MDNISIHPSDTTIDKYGRRWTRIEAYDINANEEDFELLRIGDDVVYGNCYWGGMILVHYNLYYYCYY